MPQPARPARRRQVAIAGVKILLTAASLAATIGGWAALSAGAADTDAVTVAQAANAATATLSAASASATAEPTATALPTEQPRIRSRSSR